MKALFSKGSKNGVSDNTSLQPCSLNLVAQQMLRAPPVRPFELGPQLTCNCYFAQASNPPATAPPVKKDLQVPQISPLEKRLQDMGSIRGDGSDKFYGMENVSLGLPRSRFGIAQSLTAFPRACLVWQHLLLQLNPTMSLLFGAFP